MLHKAPYRLRELVTDWVPHERTGYELLEGMAVQGYRATVTLEDAGGGGTVIRWRSTYERARPTSAFIQRLPNLDSRFTRIYHYPHFDGSGIEETGLLDDYSGNVFTAPRAARVLNIKHRETLCSGRRD